MISVAFMFPSHARQVIKFGKHPSKAVATANRPNVGPKVDALADVGLKRCALVATVEHSHFERAAAPGVELG